MRHDESDTTELPPAQSFQSSQHRQAKKDWRRRLQARKAGDGRLAKDRWRGLVRKRRGGLARRAGEEGWQRRRAGVVAMGEG
jgi:hypothetical protein